MNLPGKWPGVIRSYDADRREVRVEIPGITDGAEQWPLAEIEYPIGDKSRHTEIRILDGDLVWLEFECGDPRYPIITGWRNPNTGNSTGFRRWHHENIESDADSTQKHTSGTTYTVLAGSDIKNDAKADIVHHAGKTVTIEAGESITLKVGGSTIVIDSSSITATAAKINLN